jgi:hypothetical protein
LRLRSTLRSVPSRAGAATLAASILCGGGACTILAGIQEGHLGSLPEAGPPADAMIDATREAAADASVDAAPVFDAPPDAAVDSAADAAPARVACSPVANTILAVDESANYVGDGSGLPGFIPGVWLAKTTITDQVFLFTQLASDATQFLEYQIDFASHNVALGMPWRGSGNNVQLVDVSSMPGGANTVLNAALTVISGGVPGTGPASWVQVIPLKSYFGGPEWANTLTIGPEIARVQSGTFIISADAAAADWLIGAQGTNMSRNVIFAGGVNRDDAGFTPLSLARSNTSKYIVDNSPFFDMGGALHVFLTGVDSDGGASVYTLPENLADAAGAIVSGTVIPGSAGGRVVTARPSATTPSQALVIALVPDSTGTQQNAYGGRVDPSQLSSVAIGSPPFDRSVVLGGDVVPVQYPSGLGWQDDETAIFGQGPTGTGLHLVWLGPDGQAVFSDSSGASLFDDGLGATAAAVQFGQHLGEMGGTLYVAWIETVDSTGNQSIKAAKLSCTPVSP